MAKAPSPFVFWAQCENHVSLKVDLKDSKDPNICLKPENLSFSTFGKGARGEHNYYFNLQFFSQIVPEESFYKVSDRQIDLSFRKCEPGFWPRLTASPQKPAWLKIDFDKWISNDPDIDDEDNRNVIEDYPDLYDKLQKEERGYRIEDYRKVYLVLYNLFQLVGFTYILAVLVVKYSRDGERSMREAYENVGTVMKLCHLFMWLEVFHPIFGYTSNSAVAPLIQVGGRCFMLFVMIEAEPRMHTKPVVFYLFIVWSLVEVVRYPYYITQLYKFEIGFLTWLRYTIWIPLYPLGMFCEGVIILRDLPYFEETLRFTVSLPNAWNFSFYFPTVIRIYLLIFFLPVLFFLMSHMYKDRVRKLGPKSFRKKLL